MEGFTQMEGYTTSPDIGSFITLSNIGLLMFLICLILLPIFIIFVRKAPYRKYTLIITTALCCIGLVLVAVSAPRSDAGQNVPSRGKPYDITKIETEWVATARGLTALEGRLWVPEVRIVVKNITNKDLDGVFFKVIFLDEEQVITGDEVIEGISTIPAGYAKGPIFFQGTVGYTSDRALLGMAKDTLKKWQYDMFESRSYTGPWTKIRSGSIDLPTPYSAIK